MLKKKYNRPKHEIRIEFIRNMKRYASRRIKEALRLKEIRTNVFWIQKPVSSMLTLVPVLVIADMIFVLLLQLFVF